MTSTTKRPAVAATYEKIDSRLWLKTISEKESGRMVGQYFIFQYRLGGLTRGRSLGPAKRAGFSGGLTVRQAKQMADAHAGKLAIREDPFGKFVKQMTVGEVAEMLIKRGEGYTRDDGVFVAGKWSCDANGKCGTAEDWRRMMKACGTLARMTFAHPEIETQALRSIEPVWPSKTGDDYLVRLKKVFRVARRMKLFTGDNPCDREAIEDLLGKGRDGRGIAKGGDVKHYPSLPHAEVADFIQVLDERIAKRGSQIAKALRLLVLTPARPGNVVYARKSCIDREARLWTVPAQGHQGEKMKSGIEHTFYLNDQAMEIVNANWDLEGDYLFPGKKEGKPINEGGMGDLMSDPRTKGGLAMKAVPHGFRSTFADWVMAFHPEMQAIADAMLAHAEGKVTAAYFRNSDTMGQVKYLSQLWGDYCAGLVVKREVIKPTLATVDGQPVTKAA